MNDAGTRQAKSVALGFEPECVILPISAIPPTKQLRSGVKASRKYRQIAASIREIGIIEPPAVARNPKDPGTYLLLDGHMRIEVLKDMGITEVECLVSTDDEAFTYNKRINRLAAVQEHRMIVKAVERGVSEERIAKALDLDVQSIRRKFKLLDGVCAEAVELLKDKPCPMAVFGVLKRMVPLQQVKAADLMSSSNNYTVAYANAILVATPQSQLVDAQKKKVKGISPEQMARMERELEGLQRDIKSIEASYGTDNLNLVVVKGYLVKLLANSRITRYLARHRPEFLAEFQNIAEMTSIAPKDAA